MNPRRLAALLAFLLLPGTLLAQDAHSLGIGGAAAGAPMDLFGVYWNPSLIALPTTSPSGWEVGSGFSAFDTSNAGSPILQLNDANARKSSADPVKRFQQYTGLFAVKYIEAAGGVVYDQETNLEESQGALAFFNDRGNGSLSASPYALDYRKTEQQMANLVLTYATPFPIGTVPFFSIGASLKYHDGLYYQQTSLSGAYTQGSPGGYTYSRTTSTSGLGLSVDAGFFAKMTDAIQVGMMFENIRSSFSWQAVRQDYTLDTLTGQEVPSGPATNVTVQSPFPYAVKLGMVGTPQGKDTLLEAQVTWTQHKALWRFGLERAYPQANLNVRLGTFSDPVSNQQLWSFGVGYTRPLVDIDLAFVTRSLPALQDSIALGGALDAIVRF